MERMLGFLLIVQLCSLTMASVPPVDLMEYMRGAAYTVTNPGYCTVGAGSCVSTDITSTLPASLTGVNFVLFDGFCIGIVISGGVCSGTSSGVTRSYANMIQPSTYTITNLQCEVLGVTDELLNGSTTTAMIQQSCTGDVSFAINTDVSVGIIPVSYVMTGTARFASNVTQNVDLSIHSRCGTASALSGDCTIGSSEPFGLTVEDVVLDTSVATILGVVYESIQPFTTSGDLEAFVTIGLEGALSDILREVVCPVGVNLTYYTLSPTGSPTTTPTGSPSVSPTTSPTSPTSLSPTTSPTEQPTAVPSATPTGQPTSQPSITQTNSPIPPTTDSPTVFSGAGPHVELGILLSALIVVVVAISGL